MKVFLTIWLVLLSASAAAEMDPEKSARVLRACSEGNFPACIVYRDCFEFQREQVCSMIAWGSWLPDGRLKMVPPGLPLVNEGKPGGNPAVQAVVAACIEPVNAQVACAALWACQGGMQTQCEKIVTLAGHGPLPTPDEVPPPPHGADSWLRFIAKHEGPGDSP